MRSSTRRIALAAVAVLALSACGQGDDEPEDQAADEQDEASDALEDLQDGQDGQELEDPNEDIEDGIYRGNGVILPVPEGWSLDQQAFAQGVLAAAPEDGEQQIRAQAVDTDAAEEAGQPLEFDSLLEQIRQVGEPDVDEEVELTGAERAHRVSFYDMESPEPPQGQGQGQDQAEPAPNQSGTILLAASGDGVLAEFTFAGSADAYEESHEELLLANAGIDPDSEPPPMPAAPQPPAGGGGGQQPPPEDGGTSGDGSSQDPEDFEDSGESPDGGDDEGAGDGGDAEDGGDEG